MSDVDQVLELAEDVAKLGDEAGKALGLAPVSTVARLAGLVLHLADGARREVSAAELAAVQSARQLGEASGAAKHRASKQNFAHKCAACHAPASDCVRALFVIGARRAGVPLEQPGNVAASISAMMSKCCDACDHPEFWP